MTNYAWVIGARGLLGSAMAVQIEKRSGWSLWRHAPLPWNDSDVLDRVVAAAMRDLAATTVATGDTWTIIWAAGAAVTSSSPDQIDYELAQFERILVALGDGLRGTKAAQRGSLFYASSAGGVYAGSALPPFTETTEPVAISGYGRLKLEEEGILRGFSESHGLPVLIGRIANLYGPGQSLTKMQGLISHIARAQFGPQPTSIYVSLDTLRDYIFVEDCVSLVCDALDRIRAFSGSSKVVVKIFASGQAVTISALLGYFRALTKSPPNVILGRSAVASLQSHDLRLRSNTWTDLDRREATPLPVGIHRTYMDLLAAMQSATLG